MNENTHWLMCYNNGFEAGISFAVDSFLGNIIKGLNVDVAEILRKTTINHLIKEFNGEG